MPKKVELITLQRVPNYGSVLQAYATQQVIMSLGYACEIVNYFPERMSKRAMLRRIKNKNEKLEKSFILRTLARIIIFPSYIKRFHSFSNFYKNLNQTRTEYRTYEELKESNIKADVYCTGSDQVWNRDWNEGIDKALFWDFIPKNKKKIAYAASFGKNKLEEDEKEITKELLSSYSFISLREKTGVKILNDLHILNSVNVLDPTLLLSPNDWNIISSDKYKKDNYILIYNLNRNGKIDNYAKGLSKLTGLKIKRISYQFHEFYKPGKIYCSPSVQDFLALIKNAKYVITDSFHGTAFSLNFNKQFIIVYPNKYSTRVRSILEITELTNRVAKSENDFSIIENKINYNKVNNILSRERKKSINWFKNALEESLKNVN